MPGHTSAADTDLRCAVTDVRQPRDGHAPIAHLVEALRQAQARAGGLTAASLNAVQHFRAEYEGAIYVRPQADPIDAGGERPRTRRG